MRAAASRIFCTAGSNNPIRIAIIAMTTSSSMSVKARRSLRRGEGAANTVHLDAMGENGLETARATPGHGGKVTSERLRAAQLVATIKARVAVRSDTSLRQGWSILRHALKRLSHDEADPNRPGAEPELRLLPRGPARHRPFRRG